MNRFVRLPYSAAGALVKAVSTITPRAAGKIARSLSGRRGVVGRWRAWAEANRDASRPLLWIHAPSVGEGLQAKPVIDLVRSRHPEIQIAYSFFSPSAEKFAGTVGADFYDYLPFDRTADAEKIIDALRPSALVFSKLDVWPILVETAARKAVKLGMLSATITASSLRRSRLAQLALGNAYSLLDIVGAISDEDAQRLTELGVARNRITITGDTRYDQTWKKAQTDSAERTALARSLESSRFTFVAGSTWPSDERHLLPAWLEVKRRYPAVRLIIAPHEISRRHLRSIESWAETYGIAYARLDDNSARNADVIIVGRYGILGDLYALASAAYVGGGFHAAGLHSLLEPAAFGAPVIIGPLHTDNRDAQLLVDAGGAYRCANASKIAHRISRWVESPESLAAAQTAARTTVQEGLGAAERSLELVERLLGDS